MMPATGIRTHPKGRVKREWQAATSAPRRRCCRCHANLPAGAEGNLCAQCAAAVYAPRHAPKWWREAL